jgi:hypothetical protein
MPLTCMRPGDWFLFYSPRKEFQQKISKNNPPLQSFTGLGKIVGDKVYQIKMGNGFNPWRIDVKFIKDVKELPIKRLIDQLSFITNKKNWGVFFKYGFLEIKSKKDFQLIAKNMKVNFNELSENVSEIN